MSLRAALENVEALNSEVLVDDVEYPAEEADETMGNIISFFIFLLFCTVTATFFFCWIITLVGAVNDFDEFVFSLVVALEASV